MEDDGTDGAAKSSTDKLPTSKKRKRRLNQADHPCFLCFTQRKSGDAGRRWHHTTRGKEITQVSLCDKCYQQEYHGRKVPGAPLTQNVLAAKQLAEHPDPIASDSEEDSESGLTELKAKKQSTSKSSAPAATQAPAGPLAHAESARPESGKTAPEASFVSPVAIASDASPQPRFPFPLLKQAAHDTSIGISRSVIAASLGPQQLSKCVSNQIMSSLHVTEPCRRPGAEAPTMQLSVPEVDNGAEKGIQELRTSKGPHVRPCAASSCSSTGIFCQNL
ncbi:hypothetical protein WJX79_008843 [Trebouxia sp. C0005]